MKNNGENGLPDSRNRLKSENFPIAQKLGAHTSQCNFSTDTGESFTGLIKTIKNNQVVLEIYTDETFKFKTPRLKNFEALVLGDRFFSGAALLLNHICIGSRHILEVSIDSIKIERDNLNPQHDILSIAKNDFLKMVGNLSYSYHISTDFRIAVDNLRTFLDNLKLWTEKLQATPQEQNHKSFEESYLDVVISLKPIIFKNLTRLFDQFENISKTIPPQFFELHSQYARLTLHPFVLCSPFMRRTFQKPLGYAGDYKMVAMMVGNPFEGISIYSKLINSFFIDTPPVVAHRNRINVLFNHLIKETSRMDKNQRLRCFNLGCGPALEIHNFINETHLSNRADFTLLDFNSETIEYAKKTLDQVKHAKKRQCEIKFEKKSVAQLLKDWGQYAPNSFDFVYCAGLFDYLPDSVCSKLIDIFYELVKPGGLVFITNVHTNNPSIGWMEFVVDWKLIYRDAHHISSLIKQSVPLDYAKITVEPLGVNIFAEIRKPSNV